MAVRFEELEDDVPLEVDFVELLFPELLIALPYLKNASPSSSLPTRHPADGSALCG